MGRLILLEMKKLAKPVIAVLVILTVLTCVLSCTLFQAYSLAYVLDKWEIGTEYIGLLFPLFVVVPVCWQLYYERRDRFLIYTLPRVSKGRYLAAKWLACALSAFMLLFVPYVLSALSALYLSPYKDLHPDWITPYTHIFQTLYTEYPIVYMFLLSVWKSFLVVLTMTFGFVLAMYSANIFVVLTAPFVYMILDNFVWSILRTANAFVMSFEPATMIPSYVTLKTFLWGPVQLSVVIGLVVLYYTRLRKRRVFPL